MSHFKKRIEEQLTKKTLTITMSDNSKWAIPVWVIVLHRTEDQMEVKNDVVSFNKSLIDAIELFKDENKLILWVSTFMKWEDVKKDAVRLDSDLNFDHEWLNSAKELS